MQNDSNLLSSGNFKLRHDGNQRNNKQKLTENLATSLPAGKSLMGCLPLRRQKI